MNPIRVQKTRKRTKSVRSRTKTKRSTKSLKKAVKLKRKTSKIKGNKTKTKSMTRLTRKSQSKAATAFSEGYQARMTEPITTGMERPRSTEDTQLIQDLMAFMAKKSPSKSSGK